MKSASIKKILILVTILAVPGFLYYLLQEKGKNRYKPLPYFGPKEVAKTFHSVRGQQIPDTIYHEVQNLDMINQIGKTISWDNYKDKVLIMGLFYTRGNTHAVEFAHKAMNAFDATYAKNNRVNFASITIDPVYDRPEVLAKYAKTHGMTSDKWNLLTGDSTKVFEFINKQLFVDAHQDYEPKLNSKQYTYSNMFILIDPLHRIRGYYEATNQEALSRLDDEIKVLIAEVLRNTEDGR